MAFSFEKLLVYQNQLTSRKQFAITPNNSLLGKTTWRTSSTEHRFLSHPTSPRETGDSQDRIEKNVFGIARGSVQECVPQLELARRRKLINDETHQELKSQLEKIARMLSGLINGLENRED